MRPRIEEEARALISGARREDYGPVDMSLEMAASVWNGLFRPILTRPLTAKDVTLAMAGYKLAREAFNGKRDNRVDAIGYVLLAEELSR